MAFKKIFSIASAALTVALLATTATFASAAADDFPSRAVRIVVPFGAGGVTDVVARALADNLGRRLGVPVVVDNKPGAGSVLGAEIVAHAAADGHTLLMGANTAFTVNPNLQKKLPYDARRDFAVVSPLFTVPILVMAKPDFPANNLDELAALARKDPGKLSYGSFGQGSSSHLVMEWFKTRAGIDVVHVPYSGGAAATQALLAGQVPLGFDALTGALPQLKAGKLKAISLMQGAPSTIAPDIPTTRNSSYPDVDLIAWSALLAPAATPRDRLQKLNQAVTAVLQDPVFVARLADFGAEPDRISPAELTMRISTEYERLARVIRDANIRIDQ